MSATPISPLITAPEAILLQVAYVAITEQPAIATGTAGSANTELDEMYETIAETVKIVASIPPPIEPATTEAIAALLLALH